MKNLLFLFTLILFTFQSTGCNENKQAVQNEINSFEPSMKWDKNVLSKALEADYVRWAKDANVNTEYTRYNVLYTGKALNYLSLVAFHDKNNQYPEAATRVLEQLRYVISGGKEPACRGVIAGWADNSLAQSIALAKNTQKIWGQFTQEEKEKLDLLMEALAIAGNYCQNTENEVSRGLYQSFNWRKGWNPNHQEGYVGIMVAAWIYFEGTNQVNSIFDNFNYNNYINGLQSAGFENIVACWQNTGKTLMEDGGTDSGNGTTKGVKIPFTYSSLSGFGEIKYDPYLLYRDLAARMYKHIVTSTECNGEAYISDNSTSPYEGQTGMCYEFKGQDASGCRSSAGYCFDGWMNNILTLASLQALNLLPDNAEVNELMKKLETGSSDLFYKLQHGYHARKNGKYVNENEEAYKKMGIEFLKDIYSNIEKRR